MNAAILDADMREALEPWDGFWTPKGGLITVWQHTAQQLLRAGSQGLVKWTNADANFLQVVTRQERPLGRMQRAYFDQLAGQYYREAFS
ncbi:MAG: hypothetical protein AAGI28_03640 [Pseudomonadota bacterium]